MMRFLKSILSKKKSKRVHTNNLLGDGSHHLEKRIEQLELELSVAYDKITELSCNIETVTLATANLSNEVMCIGDIIHEAAEMAQRKETDYFSWQPEEGDDEGYLN